MSRAEFSGMGKPILRTENCIALVIQMPLAKEVVSIQRIWQCSERKRQSMNVINLMEWTYMHCRSLH